MTSKLTITDERLAELVAFKPLPGTDINSATRDEWMALAAELQERRKAEQDSEPVAWMHSNNDIGIPAITVSQKIGHYWMAEFKDVFPLYRHAQPAPVVPDNRAITQHFDTIALETAREILCDVNRRHEFLGGEVQLLSRIQCRIDAACRAAMLQAGNSPAHSGPRPEQSNGSPAQCSNSPVIPGGYVMVPKEPTKEMIDAGWLHFMGTKNPSSKGTYKVMLAAAPQEVPDGQR
ncbi:hypothetical protein [Raoultella sp. HC6]|uniref:hypothetical protein n=1 Tax=Raoultella sp. HC6 TaxID=2923366 RepID=UPI001F505843|nr:hypothetical protein [Raoultella sp. HC6]